MPQRSKATPPTSPASTASTQPSRHKPGASTSWRRMPGFTNSARWERSPRNISTRHSTRTCAGFCSPCRSEEHTSELQSRFDLVCRLLLEKKNKWAVRPRAEVGDVELFRDVVRAAFGQRRKMLRNALAALAARRGLAAEAVLARAAIASTA